MFSKLILLSLITFIGFGTICCAEEGKGKCGHPETDYSPCVTRTRADVLFRQCCQLYVPEECHDLCQYESEEIPARNLLIKTIASRKCGLKHISAILYCASQNQVKMKSFTSKISLIKCQTGCKKLDEIPADNRKCCHHLNLADNKLGVGDRCLRFCDPAGQGINAIGKSDATCLFNLNVILYCHQSGIPLD
uniref:DB domain-containing protein n=1 Tax=Wuchereria bancrofti TaxID=6293 RepID=A0A1I8EH13_WUCBA